MTRTIEVRIADGQRERLDERVRQTGGGLAEYVEALIAKDLSAPALSEILAPFRQQVQESGLSDQELDTLFREAREEAWQERLKADRLS